MNFERPEGDDISELLKKYKPNEQTIYLSEPISGIPFAKASEIFGNAWLTLPSGTDYLLVNPFSSCSPSTWHRCMANALRKWKIATLLRCLRAGSSR